jgi:hypothetical protein
MRACTQMRKAFEAPAVWVPPLVLVCVLVFVMTLVYFGSAVDPAGHLHGLPVGIVDEDGGAAGRDLAAGLTGSPAVASSLSLRPGTLAAIKARMDVGKEFAAVVIPPGFTRAMRATRGTAGPSVSVLTNPRAGTLGAGLATGILQPSLARASQKLARQAPGGVPFAVETAVYRPLPRHTALGLSAFYIALLTTFCGFLGATIVHTSIDAVLGYATTEIGPRWGQRQPVAISRRQTLFAKWTMAVPLMVVLTGLMLAAAVLILGMDTPHFGELWLLTWFAATVVAVGTLVLFAALGTVGQLVALLIFVYLALASSGGTVPLTALAGPFRFLAHFEPLRQILDGVRSILYFDGSGEAGLTRAFVATSLGLAFWVAVGVAVTTWYDRRGLHRMPPALMDYVDQAVRGYRERTTT